VKEIPGTCLETHKCLHEGAHRGVGHALGAHFGETEGERVGQRRRGALVGEQRLADYCVDSPITVDHLRHAKIHRNRNQRDRLVLR
jgi:hypothetical protein